MRHIHIISNTIGSLGEITNDIVNNLKDKFIFTSEAEANNCIPEVFDILLSHFISVKVTNIPAFNKFKKKILLQPVDGTVLHKEVVDAINKYDYIITPGNAGKQILLNNEVIKPIKVIPNYYKPEILIKPEDLSIPKLDKYIKNKFIFYHESTCHPRKGIDILCKAYVKAFSNNINPIPVVLIIKSSPHNTMTFKYLEDVKKEIIKLQKQYKYPAQILKISQYLDEETLKKLWYKTNVYVSFAKIEGFGIPLLRMYMLGKPIIALKNKLSGYMDFLNPHNSHLIPCKNVIADKELIPIYTNKTEWAIPNIEDCITKLQKVYHIPFISKINKKYIEFYSKENIMKKYEYIFSHINTLTKEKKDKREYKFIESNLNILN